MMMIMMTMITIIYNNRSNAGKRNIEARSQNNCYREKTINVTYSEWLSVVSVIQHAKSMRRIILSFGSYPALPCLLLNNWHSLRAALRLSVFDFDYVIFGVRGGAVG